MNTSACQGALQKQIQFYSMEIVADTFLYSCVQCVWSMVIHNNVTVSNAVCAVARI